MNLCAPPRRTAAAAATDPRTRKKPSRKPGSCPMTMVRIVPASTVPVNARTAIFTGSLPIQRSAGIANSPDRTASAGGRFLAVPPSEPRVAAALAAWPAGENDGAGRRDASERGALGLSRWPRLPSPPGPPGPPRKPRSRSRSLNALPPGDRDPLAGRCPGGRPSARRSPASRPGSRVLPLPESLLPAALLPAALLPGALLPGALGRRVRGSSRHLGSLSGKRASPARGPGLAWPPRGVKPGRGSCPGGVVIDPEL
jgi:hypothetical protein